MAGYAGSTDKEAIEDLVAETFGMSTVSYLRSCVPALLPSLEELQAAFDGSGAYEAADGILTRQFEEDGLVITKTECYIRQDSHLIFTEESGADSNSISNFYPMIYTLEQTRKQ